MPVRFRRRRSPRTRAQFLLLLLALAAVLLHRLFVAVDRPGEFSFDPDRLWRVERVVDGDTLLLEQGHRVRLIGVDTPETKHPSIPPEPFGDEATGFTRRLVEGRTVRLGFDRERRDRYRRILAYVYVGDVFLNEELIRAGWSPAVTRFPYSAAMKRRFEKAEAEARAARRGLWAVEQRGSLGKSSRDREGAIGGHRGARGGFFFDGRGLNRLAPIAGRFGEWSNGRRSASLPASASER